jgi:hypothetical protein
MYVTCYNESKLCALSDKQFSSFLLFVPLCVCFDLLLRLSLRFQFLRPVLDLN